MDRMPADDLIWLYSDDLESPMNTGALIIIDGRSLVDSDGRFQLEAVRRSVEQRIHLVPRFRQVIRRPRFGLGTPLWVDAQTFDVADHVQTYPLVPPVDDELVLGACEELRRRQLDSAKPPWEMWFITGLDDGQIALFIKLHHAVGDGMAGVASLAAFVDLSPDEPTPSAQDWNPADLPTNSDLFRDNLLRRLEGLKRRSFHLAHPITGIRRLRATWPFIHEVFAVRAPRTSLNRPVGPDRTMAVARGRLETYRRIAEVHGSKVNDVLLSAIGGGLRDLLISRREPVDGLVLRVMVPVSLHQEGLERGNVSSGMAVPISIGEADAVSRLKLIAAETAERKKMARPTLGLIFQSKIAQKALLRVFRRQRFENLYVTNIPGPPVPLYFSGAQILEIFPIVPTAGNVTLGIGALSYTGQFNITAIGDRELCPDLDILLQGFQQSIDELAASVLVDTS